MTNQFKIIAFSKWCDHLPLEEQAKSLKQAGFDGVDMPCRPGSAITHATAPKSLPEAKRILAGHGLSLDRLVCDIVSESDDVNERFLACLSDLGIRKIRAGGFPVPPGTDIKTVFDAARRRLETIEYLLEKHGVSAGIQNHSGDCLEANISSVLRLLEGRNPKWLGIQYDPGHLTLSGEKPHLAIGLMGDYLHSVNFKSPRQEYFVERESGRLAYCPVWVPLADGMLDVPAVMCALLAVGYRDPLSIHCEYRSHFFRVEKHPDDVFRIVKEDVAYLRARHTGNKPQNYEETMR